jgi:hypothetical protein
MFRFKFNEIDGIQKACLKTYETKMNIVDIPCIPTASAY